MSRLRADFLLLLNAIIWGAAFVAQKQANDFLGPIIFIAFRYLVSALVILPFMIWERQKTRVTLKTSDYTLAGLIGLILFGGMSLQQIGLVTTTATNAGFLTSLYVVITPFSAWFFMSQKPDRRHMFACSVSIIGAWLLSTNGTFSGALSGKTKFEASTMYYFHVRYKSSIGGWSEYSTVGSKRTREPPIVTVMELNVASRPTIA